MTLLPRRDQSVGYPCTTQPAAKEIAMFTATAPTTIAEIFDTAKPLTADDRCDRCGAPARVRAMLVAGELMFCDHHHARAASAGLATKALVAFDPTGKRLYAQQVA